MIEEKYRHVADFSQNGVEAIRRTGVQVVEMRERFVRMRMPIDRNTNHIGMMYAGSLFSLGEVIGGALFGASLDYRKYFPIAKELGIRYRRPALTDVTLEAGVSAEAVRALERELEEKGKAEIVLDLELKDAGEEVVALVHGVWQARKIPEGFAVPWAKD